MKFSPPLNALLMQYGYSVVNNRTPDSHSTGLVEDGKCSIVCRPSQILSHDAHTAKRRLRRSPPTLYESLRLNVKRVEILHSVRIFEYLRDLQPRTDQL
jgi:hypothetical protein